jgi:hypothetical protein
MTYNLQDVRTHKTGENVQRIAQGQVSIICVECQNVTNLYNNSVYYVYILCMHEIDGMTSMQQKAQKHHRMRTGCSTNQSFPYFFFGCT